LVAGSPFSPTLSQKEGTMIAALLSIAFNGLSRSLPLDSI
jgi:hypothetical protein